MKEIESRIFIEDEIFNNESSFYFESNRFTRCYVSYRHVKTDKVTCHVSGNYRECLSFARSRSCDGRYKNFEFLIFIER